MEQHVEHQRESIRKLREVQEAEQRLLHTPEVVRTAAASARSVGDATVLRDEARVLEKGRVKPEVEAEARLLQTHSPEKISEVLKAREAIRQLPPEVLRTGLTREAILKGIKVREAVLHGLKEGEGYWTPMMQGKAGEQVALLKGDRVELDHLEESLSMRGGRFPVYDIAGKDCVASVKVRGLSEIEPSDKTVGRYLEDFRTAIGEKDPDKFKKAADFLLQAKDKQLVPIPRGMERLRTREGVESYLKKHAELHIPDNHVASVQRALRADIRKFPGNYGLTRQEVREGKGELLVQRVKPLGTETDVIRGMLDTYMSRRRSLRV